MEDKEISLLDIVLRINKKTLDRATAGRKIPIALEINMDGHVMSFLEEDEREQVRELASEIAELLGEAASRKLAKELAEVVDSIKSQVKDIDGFKDYLRNIMKN